MFLLTLVTPEKRLFTDKEVEEVLVPGERGELDILSDHAPLVTTLNAGVLKYRAKGESELHALSISWGFCEINPHGVMILADTAEDVEEIDADRAKEALKTAEAKLASGLTVGETIKQQRKIKKARARLEVINKLH